MYNSVDYKFGLTSEDSRGSVPSQTAWITVISTLLF